MDFATFLSGLAASLVIVVIAMRLERRHRRETGSRRFDDRWATRLHAALPVLLM